VSTPAPAIGAETAVILFTDIVDSTALTERLGDAAYLSKAGEFERAVRRAARGSGEDIEGVTLGDGVVAVFSSARRHPMRSEPRMRTGRRVPSPRRHPPVTCCGPDPQCTEAQ
jgi:class 3 adenylate cyclase